MGFREREREKEGKRKIGREGTGNRENGRKREREEQKEGGRERDARRGKESVYERELALSHLHNHCLPEDNYCVSETD